MKHRHRFIIFLDDFQLSGLNLGEIQNVIDDSQKRIPGVFDVIQIFPCILGQLLSEKNVRHSHNGIHRRADLMRHGGQELRLCGVGIIRPLLLHPKLFHKKHVRTFHSQEKCKINQSQSESTNQRRRKNRLIHQHHNLDQKGKSHNKALFAVDFLPMANHRQYNTDNIQCHSSVNRKNCRSPGIIALRSLNISYRQKQQSKPRNPHRNCPYPKLPLADAVPAYTILVNQHNTIQIA